MSITTGIVGAAGFAGAEVVRLVGGHPDFEIRVITSDSHAGMPANQVFPNTPGCENICFKSHDDEELFECEAVFLAVPHTAALELVPALLSAGITVFDLSADYRLKDPQVYEEWYGVSHTSPELLEVAAFGLPELFHESLRKASLQQTKGKPTLVACAGCYPTASSLAAFPAVHAGWVEGTVIVDAISGITGAGKSANERTHFCFANENVEAYGLVKHRHRPEIEQILGLPGQIVFTPHLAPLNRGLLATVYLPLKEDSINLDAIHKSYSDFYKKSCFVRVLDKGIMPKTKTVAGSNYANIGLAYQEETQTLIAVAAIDNLCKGAAGQAVQCANIVFGLPEDRGLTQGAFYV